MNIGVTQTSFSPIFLGDGASVNRLDAPLYNFKTDHDTASKITHNKILIIFNVLIQLTQYDVLMTLFNL